MLALLYPPSSQITNDHPLILTNLDTNDGGTFTYML